MQEIEKLLQEISKLSKEFYAAHENKSTIERFNVFEILNVETDEKRICRFLCEILSPARALRNGFLSRDFFLKSFLEKVLGLDIPDYKLEKAEVYREYITENGRRIDIVIRSKAFRLFIPIEVKIWASDLNNQCKDYYDEAKKHDADARIFYLTPNGKLPSPESSDGVPAENMKCISFENDIYDWISYCISQSEVISNIPLREVLLQFAATVKNLTEQTKEEKLKMEIAELIRKSPDNLEAAVKIQEVTTQVVDSIRTDFFQSVEREMREKYKKESFMQDNTALDYRHNGSRRTNTNFWAGLFYVPNEAEYNPENFGARLDIENGIANIGEFKLEGEGSKWGKWHECAIDEDGKEIPNFKYPNETLCKLADPDTMKAFAEKCAREINSYLEELENA